MSWSPSSPVTGAAQTGFTSPTYTLTADIAPDSNGKQYAVTALGGTQAGVTTHSVASPFTITFVRPKVFRALGKPNPVTGLVRDVPRNTYKQITRKGVSVLSGQPYVTAQCSVVMDIPAGADTVSPAEIRAMLSLAFGAAWAQAAGIGDTTVSGVV